MSPTGSFRSLALCFALVLIAVATKVNGFAIRSAYNTTNDRLQDLAVEESLQLEVKHDFKSPNGININSTLKNNELTTTTDNVNLITVSLSQIETTLDIKEFMNQGTNNETFDEKQANIFDTKVRNNITKLKSSLPINSSLHENSSKILKERALRPQLQMKNVTKNVKQEYKKLSDLENTSLSVENAKTRPLSTGFDDFVTRVPFAQSDENSFIPTKEYRNTLVKDHISYTTDITNSTDLFSGKIYTILDRKLIFTTENSPTSTYRYEEASKSENGTTLEDSLMKGARDWILSTKIMQELESSPLTTNSYTETSQYQEISTASVRSPMRKPKLDFVSSKRAGFLNLSLKTKLNETTTENYTVETTTSTSHNDYTTPTEENNEEEHTSDSLAALLEAQRYLDEDAIKEELLQETSLKNNEEIAIQIREERINNSATTSSFTEQYVTVSPYGAEPITQSDAAHIETTFNTDPVQDKGEFKSAAIYTVSPNYKPMKKIEILPPKPFVRDPDDNSWRNESISSLGIVFKPKNSSKPLTQVLKNKTETEWSNTFSKESKSDVPGLRERLEKIARKRKTKKKNTDLFGDIIYTDYEESNSSEETTSTQNTAYPSTMTNPTEGETTFTTIVTEALVSESSTSTASAPGNGSTVASTGTVTETNTHSIPTLPVLLEVTNSTLNTTKEKVLKKVKYDSSLIDKGKKYFSIFDYYDVAEEDESEYMELAKLELKKFSAAVHITDAPFTTQPPVSLYKFTKPLTEYVPERKPTLQYFPPRNIQQPKTNRFDNDFEKKFKNYAKLTSVKQETSSPLVNLPDTPLGKYHSRILQDPNHLNNHHHTFTPDLQTIYKPNYYNKNHYHTDHPQVTTEQINTHMVSENNGGYNRGSYIIKNYKDFIDQASKDYDYDRDAGLVPYTQSPLPVATLSDLIAQEKDKVKSKENFNDDYDAKFRKEVLQRFVDNFNHNDARYNGDFPVLYNNTVMHVGAGGIGDAIASSRAFLKGLYKPADARLGYARREPYDPHDPHCDNITVELSPAYELHYYVPDQEENEEMETKAVAAVH